MKAKPAYEGGGSAASRQLYDDAADWYRLSQDAYLSIRFLHEGLLREITSRKSAVVTESSWTVATAASPARRQKVTDVMDRGDRTARTRADLGRGTPGRQRSCGLTSWRPPCRPG